MLLRGRGRGDFFASEKYELKKGIHLIIPVGFGTFKVDGDCELIVSHT
ncbi:hypothetical protein V7150_02440 [Neobacillus drentensis]